MRIGSVSAGVAFLVGCHLVSGVGDLEFTSGGGESSANGGQGGNSSSDGGSSSTGTPICTPDESMDCYNGADGTEGIGACMGGTTTCSQDGLSWSECDDVQPAAEDCGSGDDLDCNGYDCGETLYGAVYGSTGKEIARAVAVDAAGNTYVSGTFYSTVDFGNDVTITSNGLQDVFVAKFDPTGVAVWAKGYGPNDMFDDWNYAIAVSDNEEVFFGGRAYSPVDIGGITAQVGIYVAKLKVDGETEWVAQVSANSDGDVISLDVAPSGRLIVCGTVKQELFGSYAGFQGTGRDAFVVRMHADTKVVLQKLIFGGGDTLADDAVDCKTDDDDGIFVTGYFQGELNVDVEGVDAYGGRDVFVLKYNPVTDTVEWAVSAGDTDEWDVGRALAIDPLTEDIWVTGYFEGTADFGNGTVFANETQGNIFVSRYSKNGTPKGGASFGNASGPQQPFGIVADGFGGAVIAAHTYSLVNFGGGSLGDEGGSDIVMLKVDQDFGHVWSNAYGSIGDDGVQAMTQIGNLPIVVGYTNGTIDFGSETYPGIGDLDMFILKTAP